MFDLSLPKLLVLAVLALVIFGPDRLPKIAAQAGRAVEKDVLDGLGAAWAPSSVTSTSTT